MSSLLGYNYLSGDWRDHISLSTRNVAILFGKNLVRDQVTVEYASRIRALVKLFKNEPDLFSPSLICFCGGKTNGNHVSNADAGYIFFRHMCEAQNVNLDGIEIFIDRKSKNEGEALKYCTDEVRKYLPKWLEASPAIVEDNAINSGMPYSSVNSSPKGKKIHVHFSIFSTEYHLCNMNDIHHRSPQQSFLKEIQVLEQGTINYQTSYNKYSGNVDDNDNLEYSGIYNDYNTGILDDEETLYNYQRKKRPSMIPKKSRGIVETSWSFQYATYPFIYAQDDVTVFLGKCYLLNEELMPLYVNMKGVIEKVTFSPN